ncbi:DNA internalization-related competence protein ComEC/Rec2 [Acinetobacter silvestris]|uniref:DNA internalization-related competence protein ComEC/Rec2 n=1 Tax=Acinetobacter silvestris TaxID=1977882 RepID=A0A1Y3CL69_9GAMM|nr:DNA internalization-related competence protein ComEC/Rec2 [Acinetobacter silvestris]OTG66639.1 DNA internalization-related competence protein ComEC/Rec2 [Acinetobacter silvestris]
MTGLFTLLGWIFGISMMGRNLPHFISTLWPMLIFFSSLIIVLLWLKRSLSQHRLFQFVKIITFTLTSFVLAVSYADHALQQRLVSRVSDVSETEAIVYIAKINQLTADENGQRLKQSALVLHISGVNSSPQPIQLLLTTSFNRLQPQFELGQYYKVSGTIKPAHSYAVAGVFDVEQWYLQDNIMGMMNIKFIQPLSKNEVSQIGYTAFVHAQDRWLAKIRLSIERQRLYFRNFIEQQPLMHKGLLLALLTGDESLLSKQTQDLFKRLGISHLLAISGPHVLIFAVIFCFVLAQLIQYFKPHLYLRYPKPHLVVFPFLICVWLYTAFVGFEIPALRTLFTVMLVSAVLLLNQKIQALKLLLCSASILLLFDPFSILSAAFWLSYGACFILIRVYQTLQDDALEQVSSWQLKVRRFIRVLIESQWKVFIALFPLVILIFQQVSWISPVTNLIAIPLIGAIIVPLEVMGAMMSVFIEPLGLFFFHIADWVIQFLVSMLNFIDQNVSLKLEWMAFTPWMLVCLAIAVVIVFLPRGIVPKTWALVCVFPIFFAAKAQHEFELTVLDVGQGQAIFLNLPKQKMLIDTGGYYDETKFSMGKQVLIPYLMQQGIAQLDRVLLSHLDQDHSGAFEAINAVIKSNQVYSNEKDQRFDSTNFNYCYAGQKWQFDQITVEILSPLENSLSDVKNNQNELSCVVYIHISQAVNYQNFLIMGDAGWEAEYQLLQQYPDLKVDVLILGHHGSQHSSSFEFLKRLHPKLAIASAGFNNRYGHPHSIVLERLKALSIPVYTTIQQGSIKFSLLAQGQMQIESYRHARKWLQR